MDDGLREIPGRADGHGCCGGRRTLARPSRYSRHRQSLLFSPLIITSGASLAVGSGGSNDRDNVMKQRLRKERATSRRRLNGPEEKPIAWENGGTGAIQGWALDASATEM
jgi:hypothetical protein